MKKFILSTALFMLLAAMFIGCASTSADGKEDSLYPEFKVGRQDVEDGGVIVYRYWIIETPAKYTEFNKTTVFYLTGDGKVGDMWKKDKLLEIQTALQNGKFGYFEMGGEKRIYLTELKNN